jgi:hypothetical protein
MRALEAWHSTDQGCDDVARQEFVRQIQCYLAAKGLRAPAGAGPYRMDRATDPAKGVATIG